MKKYGVTCSEVWNRTTSLSAKSPCTALRDHKMSIVHADVLGHNDGVEAAKMSQFYHGMKHIKMKTKHHVLRRKTPYSVRPTRVTLYYSDNTHTLREVIAEDGRFNSSATCVDSEGRPVDDEHVSQVMQDQGLTIVGKATIRTSV